MKQQLMEVLPRFQEALMLDEEPPGQFSETENPELISFFIRPEYLSGPDQLAVFFANDPEVVTSPWGELQEKEESHEGFKMDRRDPGGCYPGCHWGDLYVPQIHPSRLQR